MDNSTVKKIQLQNVYDQYFNKPSRLLQSSLHRNFTNLTLSLISLLGSSLLNSVLKNRKCVRIQINVFFPVCLSSRA